MPCMEVQVAPRQLDQVIADLATTQHGVVSRYQLTAAGASNGALGSRIRRGRLHRVHRGVYAVGHPLLTWDGKLMAAVLASGPSAVISHRSAADHLELRRSGTRKIDVTVSTRAARRTASTLVLHRSRSLPAGETTVHRGIPVTTPARTLLDLAAVVDRRSLERAVDQAEALRIFDLAAIRAVLAAHRRRAGCGALRSVLDRWTPHPHTRSDLEDLFLALCDAHDLERPLVNTLIGEYEVDFLWPRQRVIVETDSHRHHGTRAAFERDRERDARLTAAGYRVVRFTYWQVVEQPAFVAGVIRSLLVPPD